MTRGSRALTTTAMANAIEDAITDEIEDALTRPNDPAQLGWPPTLPIEVALRTASIKEICESYNLTKEDWDALRHNPAFVSELAGVVEALKKEGVSFQMKARLQAEEILKTSWKMIHDRTGNVPAQVKADLIKSTMKWAGYDNSAQVGTGQQNTLQIQINL